MFSFIKFFIGLSFLMSFNFSVQAQIPDSSYTTLRGFTFKQVVVPKLPTRDEYQSLFDSFESTAEFVKLFPKPGSSSNLIWTSNAHLVEFVRFVKFSPLDPFGDVAQSQRRLSVYCVK